MQKGNEWRDVEEVEHTVLVHISKQKSRPSFKSTDVDGYCAVVITVNDSVKSDTSLVSQQWIAIGIYGQRVVARVDRWAVFPLNCQTRCCR